MAVLRGQTIDSKVAESHLERLERLKKELIATKTPDKEALQVFLNEAGGVELADLGEAFSRAEATRRTRIGNLLIGFLTDPDWNRRDSAARILGAMGVREAVKPLRQLVFQPAGESLARLAALRSLNRLGGLTPDEIAMLRLDSSPLIRDEADRLLADLEKNSLQSEKPIALSDLLRTKRYPTAVFDNHVERDIILSLSQKVQPAGELAEQIGRSPTTVRRHLALLRNGALAQPSLQSQEFPLVASRKNGKIIEYRLTTRGRNLTDFASRAYSRFLIERERNPDQGPGKPEN